MLDFSNCCFDGQAHLSNILSAHFSCIRVLNLHHTDNSGVSRDRQCGDVSTLLDPSNVPAIENVMIHPLPTSNLFPFLRSALCASFLPNGALKSIRRPASESVFKTFLVPCLNGGRDHLRELRLDVDSCEFVRSQGTLGEHFNSLRSCLASCTTLESVTLAIEGKRHEHRVSSAYVNAMRAVISTYARVVCPPPQSVRILVLRVQGSPETDAVEDAVEAIIAVGEVWGWLDAALCAHEPLARFAFVFEDADRRNAFMAEEDWERVSGTAGGLLRKLREKGTLVMERVARRT